MEIQSLTESHIEEAASLFLEQYHLLRQSLPFLPDHSIHPERIQEKLLRLAREYPSAAAFENGKLVGYLCGLPVDNLKGKCKSVYVPEWAHAVQPDATEAIYEELYTAIARPWALSGWFQQTITILRSQPETEDFFYTHGFGLHVEDGVRGLQPAAPRPQNAALRPVEKHEAGLLMHLEQELQDHMHNSPIFLFCKTEERTEWLSRPANRAWFALANGEPCGFILMEPNAEDKSYILRDDKTCSIVGAYVRRGQRGKGLMTSLVGEAMHDYAEKGFILCAVDFETQNDPARHYWRRHFHCTTRSLIRRVDERINDPA